MSDPSNLAVPEEKRIVSAAPTISDSITVMDRGGPASIKEKDSEPRTSSNSKLDKDVEATRAESDESAHDTSRYLSGMKLFTVFCGFLTAILLVALDQTIVATALPKILSEFNALSSITWIISGYFLTQAGLMLTYSQMLTLAPTKWLFLAAILIFEIGSLICGVAPNVNVLIFGRAFAGVGASGIFISILSSIAEVTRLEQRPALFGAFGAVFAFSSVVGPLIGGAFSDYLTWRWCFYINLPLGAVSIVTVAVFLTAHPPIDPSFKDSTFFQKVAAVDWIGTILCLIMVVTLLLPLQWGGNEREWNDPVVIALLVVFAVSVPIFVGWQWYKGQKGIMPLSLFRNKTQVGTVVESFCVMLCMLVAIYYLPFFYQATRGRSATESGIDILPFMLSTIISAGVSGGVISYTGRYWYWLVFGPLITSIGAGLLFTLTPETSNAALIGYQILFGAGVGCAMQNTIIAIQAAYNSQPKLIPQATSLVTFFQLVGGIIGVAIAGSIFANKFRAGLLEYAPDLPAEFATGVRQSVAVIALLPPQYKEGVIRAYVYALDWVFLIGIPASILGSIAGGLLIENIDLKSITSAGGAHLAI